MSEFWNGVATTLLVQALAVGFVGVLAWAVWLHWSLQDHVKALTKLDDVKWEKMNRLRKKGRDETG